MTKRVWLVMPCLALALGAFADSPKSGPDAGANAPLLHIKPFNTDAAPYCVTCKAGLKPAAVLFVSKDDEASRKAVLAFDASAKQAAADQKTLHSAVILVGSDEQVGSLKAFVREQKLSVTAAVLPRDNNELAAWHLSDKVATTVSLINGHRVKSNLTEPKPEQVTDGVKSIVG